MTEKTPSTTPAPGKKRASVKNLTRLGILVAIMVIMAFTPLGYLPIGAINVSFLTIPVVVGAVLIGPWGGAVLGAVFGITSFIKCFSGDPFGVFLMTIDPLLTFLMCMLPRILVGLLVGLIFRRLNTVDKGKTKTLSYVVTSVMGALLNTVLFTVMLLYFFGGNDAFWAQMAAWDLNTSSVFVFLSSFIGLNGVLEAGVNLVFGFALARIMSAVDKRTPDAPIKTQE